MKFSKLLLILILPTILFAQEKTALVTARKIQDVAIDLNHNIPAKIVSLNNSDISSEISGKILSIIPKVGDFVKQGEKIANIDCYNYKIALEQQQAMLASLQSELDLITWQVKKTQLLAKNNNTSEDLLRTQKNKLNQTKANINKQELQIKQAAREVQNCKIIAPFSGIISKRFANKGELINIGSKIANIIDIKNIEVTAQVYSKQIDMLSTNDIYFSSNNVKYPIDLRKVIANVDEKTNSQMARFVFKPKNKEVPLPGTSGRVIWQLKTTYIPAAYLQRRNDFLGVFIAKDDTAKFIAIKNAIVGQPFIANLPQGTLIIEQGRTALKDNQKIIIHN